MTTGSLSSFADGGDTGTPTSTTGASTSHDCGKHHTHPSAVVTTGTPMEHVPLPIPPPPLPPWMQRWNWICHVPPYSHLVHAFVWSVGLVFVAPLMGLAYAGWAMVQWVRGRFGPPEPISYVSSLRGPSLGDGTPTTTTTTKTTKPTVELAVYVTGCDTGFGRDFAFALAEKGFVVFAACLTDEGMDQFRHYQVNDDEEPRIRPLKVDVTRVDDCTAAAAVVKAWMMDEEEGLSRTPQSRRKQHHHHQYQRYLHAVINNAGIGIASPIEWLDVSDFRQVMEVNYFGTIHTVQSMLPLLKAQAFSLGCPSVPNNHNHNNKNKKLTKNNRYREARIVVVTSMAGLVVREHLSTYYASKHAQEALVGCLRMELAATYGDAIQVVSVNPSTHGDNGNANANVAIHRGIGRQIQQRWNALSKETQAGFGHGFYQACLRQMCVDHTKLMWRTENVTRVVVHRCILARYPPPQVLLGVNAIYPVMVYRMLPVSVQMALLHGRPGHTHNADSRLAAVAQGKGETEVEVEKQH